MNASEFRKYVTTSKAGHVTLTLIHKATRVKVRGQYKHASVAQAMANEYPAMVEKLASRVAAIPARGVV